MNAALSIRPRDAATVLFLVLAACVVALLAHQHAQSGVSPKVPVAEVAPVSQAPSPFMAEVVGGQEPSDAPAASGSAAKPPTKESASPAQVAYDPQALASDAAATGLTARMRRPSETHR